MEKINIDIGGYTRPFVGEHKNGDAIFIHQKEDFCFFAIVDGIGHGQPAFEISSKIKEFLSRNISINISKVIQDTHQYMLGCEGAALGIGVIDHNNFYFGSLGNISCKVINKENIDLLSTDGLLGVRGRTVKVSHKPLEDNDLILIHSDGLDSSFTNSKFKNYHLFSSEILAKKIIKQWGSMFDDASLIAVKIKK
ncbi:SpoIIE family protein phosphatase [Flammeovirga sp. EKP202]|uniref:SpoIIE family protein phosphatase n=1 Tax=Flammeovirga sp. EKP202 TaxID=2770592 RepID=UPI00165ED9EA|nr:SpoIIE family protein phosphatase [Flammeovirga sp. EKP202]MBD0400686.1 SpoIIE family protein phosphatase [Flammeovirga sp. EKP202]